MLTPEDEDFLRNFDKYLAQASLKDPDLILKSATQEGAFGPEYRGKVDPVALKAAFPDDFVFISPSGRRLEGDEFNEYAEEGDPYVEEKDTTITELRSNDAGDTAWMTGTLIIKGSMRGRSISGKYSSSAVFVKRDGQWQQVLLHLSRDA
jgi:ketosteroid isomerase-like protein